MTPPDYDAGLSSVLRNSAFIARRALLRRVRELAGEVGPDQTWIDLGCGMRPYAELLRAKKYLGIDIETSGRSQDEKKPDLYYDGKRIPMDDGSVDAVLCTQVLEHAADHGAMVDEIKRVLRPGGAALVTLPFVWPQHEKPYDYYRFTQYQALRLFEERGFKVARLEKTTREAETLAQLASTYLASSLISKLPFGRGVMVALVCAPLQLLGLALSAVLPDSGDLYLDNAVLAFKA